MDFDRYGKVKCSKIEGMMPKLMKMVKGEMKKYEINSMGNRRVRKALRRSAGSGGKVATVSQHTRTIRKDYGF